MVKSGSLFALVAVVLLAVTVSGSDGKFNLRKTLFLIFQALFRIKIHFN